MKSKREARLAARGQTIQLDRPNAGTGCEGVPPPSFHYSKLPSGGSVREPFPVSSGKLIRATLDPVFYKVKPTGAEFGAITRRLQRAEPVTITAAEFCEHIKHGGTWVGAVYGPGGQLDWGRFAGQQLFALDFDNSADGAPLSPGEPGFLDPVDALIRIEDIGLAPLCLYFTLSARCPDWPKYRVVFDAEMLADEDAAKVIIKALLDKFPEADQACKNPNRIFLGSQGEVWDCWKSWGDRDG